MTEHDPATLDEGVLRQLLDSVEGDRQFVVELVDAYLADGHAHVDAVRRAAAEDDADAVVRPAHTLKSSSATVGAMAISSTARELEAAARGGSLDARSRELAERLEREWGTTEAALRAWLVSGE